MAGMRRPALRSQGASMHFMLVGSASNLSFDIPVS
jgi:hypothetical protein